MNINLNMEIAYVPVAKLKDVQKMMSDWKDNNKKIRVGVIGCGRISVMHFVSIASIDSLELVACCDIVKEKADEAAREYGIKAYTSYEEMLECENLDESACFTRSAVGLVRKPSGAFKFVPPALPVITRIVYSC